MATEYTAKQHPLVKKVLELEKRIKELEAKVETLEANATNS